MATELQEEVKTAAAEGEPSRSILTSKMMSAVDGFAWRKSADKNGVRKLDADERTDRAFRAEKALRKSVKQGLENPQSVVKGMDPGFAAEYGLFMTAGRQDPLVADLARKVQELSADLGKNFTTSSPLSTGLVPFDLEAPSKLIYWFETPLRDKLAREPGRGTSHRTKIITGVSGSQTGASGGKIKDIAIAELSSFTTPGQSLPGAGTQDSVDVSVPYKFLGLSESLSWLAQFAGQGFEDITALANLILMQEMHFGEEYMTIGGTATALAAPLSVTCTVRTAASNETAITNGGAAHNWVAAAAVNYYGETTVVQSSDVSAISNTQVVDVVIGPDLDDNAGQQYALYVDVANGGAVAKATQFRQAQFGGTKFTLQGTMSTTTGTDLGTRGDPDTGTSATGRYEGLLSVVSGHAGGSTGAGSTVYPANHMGRGNNLAVQDTLNINTVNALLQGMYNGTDAYRANPEELICEGTDAKNLSVDVATNAHGTNFQLLIEQGDTAGIRHGTAVSQFVNPITRKIMEITVHPGFLQGTALATQWSTPQSARNSNVFEMRMVQELMSVSWPVIDAAYRFSAFEYGTLFAQAPQFSGMLSGLQSHASNPWS